MAYRNGYNMYNYPIQPTIIPQNSIAPYQATLGNPMYNTIPPQQNNLLTSVPHSNPYLYQQNYQVGDSMHPSPILQQQQAGTPYYQPQLINASQISPQNVINAPVTQQGVPSPQPPLQQQTQQTEAPSQLLIDSDAPPDGNTSLQVNTSSDIPSSDPITSPSTGDTDTLHTETEEATADDQSMRRGKQVDTIVRQRHPGSASGLNPHLMRLHILEKTVAFIQATLTPALQQPHSADDSLSNDGFPAPSTDDTSPLPMKVLSYENNYEQLLSLIQYLEQKHIFPSEIVESLCRVMPENDLCPYLVLACQQGLHLSSYLRSIKNLYLTFGRCIPQDLLPFFDVNSADPSLQQQMLRHYQAHKREQDQRYSFHESQQTRSIPQRIGFALLATTSALGLGLLSFRAFANYFGDNPSLPDDVPFADQAEDDGSHSIPYHSNPQTPHHDYAMIPSQDGHLSSPSLYPSTTHLSRQVHSLISNVDVLSSKIDRLTKRNISNGTSLDLILTNVQTVLTNIESGQTALQETISNKLTPIQEQIQAMETQQSAMEKLLQETLAEQKGITTMLTTLTTQQQTREELMQKSFGDLESDLSLMKIKLDAIILNRIYAQTPMLENNNQQYGEQMLKNNEALSSLLESTSLPQSEPQPCEEIHPEQEDTPTQPDSSDGSTSVTELNEDLPNDPQPHSSDPQNFSVEEEKLETSLQATETNQLPLQDSTAHSVDDTVEKDSVVQDADTSSPEVPQAITFHFPRQSVIDTTTLLPQYVMCACCYNKTIAFHVCTQHVIRAFVLTTFYFESQQDPLFLHRLYLILQPSLPVLEEPTAQAKLLSLSQFFKWEDINTMSPETHPTLFYAHDKKEYQLLKDSLRYVRLYLINLLKNPSETNYQKLSKRTQLVSTFLGCVPLRRILVYVGFVCEIDPNETSQMDSELSQLEQQFVQMSPSLSETTDFITFKPTCNCQTASDSPQDDCHCICASPQTLPSPSSEAQDAPAHQHIASTFSHFPHLQHALSRDSDTLRAKGEKQYHQWETEKTTMTQHVISFSIAQWGQPPSSSEHPIPVIQPYDLKCCCSSIIRLQYIATLVAELVALQSPLAQQERYLTQRNQHPDSVPVFSQYKAMESYLDHYHQ